MSNSELGKFPDKLDLRDAVHIAIIPCTAGERVCPGDKIKISNGMAYQDDDNFVGVVDPFLTTYVSAGKRFWLCLKPNSVKNIRHDWTMDNLGLDEQKTDGIKSQEMDKTLALEILTKFANQYNISMYDFCRGIEKAKEGGYHCVNHDIEYPTLSESDILLMKKAYCVYYDVGDDEFESPQLGCAC